MTTRSVNFFIFIYFFFLVGDGGGLLVLLHFVNHTLYGRLLGDLSTTIVLETHYHFVMNAC